MVADYYRRIERELSEDPIIVDMASEILEAIAAKSVQLETFAYSDEETPRYYFMLQCMEEYNKRGGKIETHIGGPARAILAIVKGKEI